jgi:hypothetical protein
LLFGDGLVLLAFSLGGMAFHHVPGNPVVELIRIGLPFAIGYFLMAHLLGGTRWDASGRKFAGRTLGSWLVGIGLGVLLRVVVEGRPPILSFVLVTFAFTGTLFVLWHGAYWWVRRLGPTPM